MGCKTKLSLSQARKSKRLLAKRRARKVKVLKKKAPQRLQPTSSDSNPGHSRMEGKTSQIIDETVQDNQALDINFGEIKNKEGQASVNTEVEELDQDKNEFEVEEKIISRETESLEGRRIVDIQFLFQQIFSFPHIGLFSCGTNDVEVIKEIRKGFISSFVLKCKVCKSVHTIYSDKQDCNINTNDSIVSGAVSIGCGFSQLKELSGHLNIPSMSYRLYNKIEEEFNEVFQEQCWEAMLEAGREEANLATEAGEIDENGIPLITVVADGAWCKRSYRNNYNAKSGAACIIGQRTGKLLFLGIRNKYCSMCKSSLPKAHKCFKNWEGPSTAMETDIIVEGFKSSMQMHNVKYAYLVGDGDSSVYKKILKSRPYGSFTVKKIECSNHLLRNYCTQLRTLSQKQFSSKGVKIPILLRHSLKNNIERLRLAIRCAVKYRSSEDGSTDQKTALLKKDIGNSIHHVFGDHKQCEKYFCKGPKSGENNLVPDLKNCGLYNDISSHINRLIYNSRSLIMNMTNNKSENYNSILAKFIGGKRIDFSRKGGYQMRCHAAGLSLNSKGEYISKIHKAVCDKSPGKYTKKFIREKKRSLCRKRLTYPSNKKTIEKKSKNKYCGPDEDYGLAPVVTEEEKQEFLQLLEKTENEKADIERKTREQSSCDLWIEERRKRLTASTFGRICKLRETTSRSKTSQSILQGFAGSRATKYGIDNEATALKEFGTAMKKDITTCGFFIDPTENYLGASPDGLVGDDGVVEIKCPYKARFLTPEEAIKEKKVDFACMKNGSFILKRNHSYYYQVQGQLHITRRCYCFFVFWTPKGFLFEKIYRDKKFFKTKMQKKLKTFYFDFYLPELINYLRENC